MRRSLKGPRGEKRSADVISMSVKGMRIATGEEDRGSALVDGRRVALIDARSAKVSRDTGGLIWTPIQR
jgi:hypothetical protein